MKKVNDVGDTKTVYKMVKTFSGKTDKKPPIDLNINGKTDNLIADATERDAVMYGMSS